MGKLRGEESNLRCLDQNQECYRYTTPDCWFSLAVLSDGFANMRSHVEVHERGGCSGRRSLLFVG